MAERAGWPALDGVRAMAVVMVMCVHAGYAHLQGGFAGVDVFFVLSGFLITTGLIGEERRTDTVSVRNFYIRRALRLFPALALAILLCLAIIAAGRSAGLGHYTVTGLPWVILYVGDVARAVGSPYTLGLLGHCWSLAVEEQFYLVWPAVFIAARLTSGRRSPVRVAAVLAGLAVLDAVWRIVLVAHGASLDRIAYSPDDQADGLLLGCALAFWLAGRTPEPRIRALLRCAAVAGMAGLAVVLVGFNAGHLSAYAAGVPVAVASSAALIATIVGAPWAPIDAILGARPAVWIGKRSYGIYLYHYPIFKAVGVSFSNHGPRVIAEAVVLSLLAAGLSFWLIERPALRLKDRFVRVAVGAQIQNLAIPTDQ